MTTGDNIEESAATFRHAWRGTTVNTPDKLGKGEEGQAMKVDELGGCNVPV